MSDKAEQKHTDLPWEYFRAMNYDGFAIAPKGTLPTLGCVERCGDNVRIECFNFPGETEGNAALIVKAVNNHYKLVEALEALLADSETTLELSYGDEDDWEVEDPEVYALILKARQALAEVK